MKNLTKVTELTENEIKAMYLNAITVAKSFGFTEEEAREITQESVREFLKK